MKCRECARLELMIKISDKKPAQQEAYRHELYVHKRFHGLFWRSYPWVNDVPIIWADRLN